MLFGAECCKLSPMNKLLPLFVLVLLAADVAMPPQTNFTAEPTAQHQTI